MKATTDLLRVASLGIQFGDQPVVEDLCLHLQAGECLGLVGESGSGKSITARALVGLLPAGAKQFSGSIVWQSASGEAVELGAMSAAARRRLRSQDVGFIFQEPLSALNPSQSIGQQLRERLLRSGQIPSSPALTKALHDWLERVQLLEPERILAAYPHTLSGGQRQRVLIAMAMAARPRLLIADEPTTALDAITEVGIIDLLQSLAVEEKVSLLFISHDLALVQQLADRVLILRNGKTVEHGRTQQIFNQPQADYTKALIAASPKLQPIKSELSSQVPAESKRVLSARDIRLAYPLSFDWLGRPKTYLQALDGVSIACYAGEMLALVGKSGCGKSSLAACLCGLNQQYSGEISVAGKVVQLVFQDPYSSLNPARRIGSMLAEVVKLHQPQLSVAEVQTQTNALLQAVELDPTTYAQRLPQALSGGQRQRVAIARALAAQPRLLICDEAVSALDASLQSGIMELLRKIAKQQQCSVLFISHDLALVRQYAHRIIVMEAGKINEKATSL